MPRRLLAMTHIQPGGPLSRRKIPKSRKLCSPSQSEWLINGMANNDRHPIPPFACPDLAPSVSPRAWGFLSWNAGGDCGLAGSLSPRATAANAASAPQGMHASQLTMPMAPVLIPLVEIEVCSAGAPHILSHPTASYMHERICSIYNSSRNHR